MAAKNTPKTVDNAAAKYAELAAKKAELERKMQEELAALEAELIASQATMQEQFITSCEEAVDALRAQYSKSTVEVVQAMFELLSEEGRQDLIAPYLPKVEQRAAKATGSEKATYLDRDGKGPVYHGVYALNGAEWIRTKGPVKKSFVEATTTGGQLWSELFVRMATDEELAAAK